MHIATRTLRSSILTLQRSTHNSGHFHIAPISRPFLTSFRSMSANGSVPALRPEEVTGSTPSSFVLPPDKPEYHAYRLSEEMNTQDWQNDLDLETAAIMMQAQPSPLRFLVLYGSLRETSYSRLLAFEMARLLEVCEMPLDQPKKLNAKHRKWVLRSECSTRPLFPSSTIVSKCQRLRKSSAT